MLSALLAEFLDTRFHLVVLRKEELVRDLVLLPRLQHLPLLGHQAIELFLPGPLRAHLALGSSAFLQLRQDRFRNVLVDLGAVPCTATAAPMDLLWHW